MKTLLKAAAVTVGAAAALALGGVTAASAATTGVGTAVTATAGSLHPLGCGGPSGRSCN